MKGSEAGSWRHALPAFIVGGRKRRFGITGILNILITNIILQFSLASGMSIALSTLISQLFNGLCGYFLYGTLVFRQGNPRTWATPLRYGVLFMGLWFSNWAGISLLQSWVTSRNLAAILMIPILAILSYFTQKHWVFAAP
jgi:putative flippase GtrA